MATRKVLVVSCDGCGGKGPDVTTVEANLGWAQFREADLCDKCIDPYNALRVFLLTKGRRKGTAPQVVTRPVTSHTPKPITIPNPPPAPAGKPGFQFPCPDEACRRLPPLRGASAYRAHRRIKHKVTASAEPLPPPVEAPAGKNGEAHAREMFSNAV